MNDTLLYSIHNLDTGIKYEWYYGDTNVTIVDTGNGKSQTAQLWDNTFLGFAFSVWDHEGRRDSECLYSVTDIDSEYRYEWLEGTDYIDIKDTGNPEDNQRIPFNANPVSFDELVDSHRRSYWLGDNSSLFKAISLSL